MQCGSDRLVVHLLDNAEDQDSTLIRDDSGESLVKDAPQILSFQAMHWIIAIGLLDSLHTCFHLMFATTSLAPCQMKAAQSDRPG